MQGLNNVGSLIFVCASNDFHAMDWFHEVKIAAPRFPMKVVTDIFYSSKEHNSEVRNDDEIIILFNIQPLIFSGHSFFYNFWRNAIKLLFTPLQVLRLRRISKMNDSALFHAHSMYYVFLCWLSGVRFIATPMGSDVLVRPEKSILYKYFTKKSLKAAEHITVDSTKIQEKIKNLIGKDSYLIQNGIDVKSISLFKSDKVQRSEIVSIRAIDYNYQIHRLIEARNFARNNLSISFVYPFYDDTYRKSILNEMKPGDHDLGRLSKNELYHLLSKALLVISIPLSDSSPRSVYEAIFSGCAIVIKYSSWIDSLPSCMRERIIVADLNKPDWLQMAIQEANRITSVPFVPSHEALYEFDQQESIFRVCQRIYKII
jgi:hypothetical protein